MDGWEVQAGRDGATPDQEGQRLAWKVPDTVIHRTTCRKDWNCR